MNQATLVNDGMTTLNSKTLRGKKLSAITGTGHKGDDSHATIVAAGSIMKGANIAGGAMAVFA